MKRGAKPNPTHLRIIQGNPSGRPLNTREPKVHGNLKHPPKWLTVEQRDGWEYAIEHAPVGLLKCLDRSVLAIWCIAEDTHRQASEKIQQEGLLCQTPNGMPMQSPYVIIQNKQAMIMIRAAAELGFTPSSRSQIRVEQESSNAFANNGKRQA